MAFMNELNTEAIDGAARQHAAELTCGSAEDVAPCLRVAIERGLASTLQPILAEIAAGKEHETAAICQKFYSGYLESVEQVVQSSSEADELRRSVMVMNDTINREADVS